MEGVKSFDIFTFSGSKSLQFLTQLTGVSIDRVNFIVCQLVALVLSFTLKKWIINPKLRMWFCLFSGMAICFFCFGNQIFHIIVMAGLSFILMWSNSKHPSKHMPWLVLGTSLLYLSLLHLKRQFWEPGSSNLDITAPMMVLVQKVSSLAFSVHDGHRKQKKDEVPRTELEASLAIREMPSLLKYWSFVFQFQSMLAGPLVMYKDYIEFTETKETPSCYTIVVQKLASCIFFAIFLMNIEPFFEFSTLKEDEFLNNTSLLYKFYYLNCATTLARCKYYHAWILGDAVCNASGLGYDKKKKTWDLTTNVHPIQFEFSLNFKGGMDNWNIGTGKWLRYVMYDRTNSSVRTLWTYILSAIWHGFYPGYYTTFLTGALFTSAGRTVRRHLRPFFQHNFVTKRFYDFCSLLMTRFASSYFSFSFALLDFIPSFMLYKKMYFSLHLLAAAAMVLLPPLSKMISNLFPFLLPPSSTVLDQSTNYNMPSKARKHTISVQAPLASDLGPGSESLGSQHPCRKFPSETSDIPGLTLSSTNREASAGDNRVRHHQQQQVQVN